MFERRKAQFIMTIRADHGLMWDAAHEVGLRDWVDNDPPEDDDDPYFNATATLTYGDRNNPDLEPKITDIWRLLALLGDRAEVWVRIDDRFVATAEAYVPTRKASILLNGESLGGELSRRIQKAVGILEGHE